MTTEEKMNEIADEIKRISAAMRRFRDGPLNRRCVGILLKDATGIGLRDIYAVLDGAAALEETYLKDDDSDS